VSRAAVFLPVSPYKGLVPFEESELDALFFFGRERETGLVTANLMAARLTVLYGPIGVGKSSLLRAGVAHALREQARASVTVGARPELGVVVFSSWRDEPIAGIRAATEACARALLDAAEPPPPETSLADALGHWATQLGGDLYLILDQLEEYFLYHGRDGEDRFLDALAEVVNRPDLRINVLLGVRDDALASLDAFKTRIPRLFSNYLRLDHLDRDAGRSAILRPLEQYHRLGGERYTAEPELVEAVLDQVGAGQIDYGLAGRGVVETEESRERIEAPYLQLVLERLWQVERERGSTTLRRATLAELGGAERIVEEHLERALAGLDDEEKETAAELFNHLVTPSGAKIAHGIGDLARYAGADEGTLRGVVDRLTSERVLRPLADGDGSRGRYEIFHDVLADAVLAWRARWESERELRDAERRHRRALVLAALAAIALAVVAGIAIFALVQRGDARRAATSADARALTARALSELDVDPQRALALAARAAELEPTTDTEAVLRRALLAARLRHVLPAGGAVSTTAFAAGGRDVLTSGAGGRVSSWDASTGRLRYRLRHGAPVVALDARDGVRTVGGRELRWWSSSDGKLIASRRAPWPIRAAALGPGTVVAAGGSEIGVWRGRTRVQILRGAGHVLRLVIGDDGRHVAAIVSGSGGRHQAVVYDLGGPAGGRVLPGRGVSDIDISRDGNWLAAASRDGSARVWRLGTEGKSIVLDDGGKALVDTEFSPDGTLLATASSDGGVRVWRVPTGGRYFFFVGHANPVTHVAFSPDGAYVVSTSSDRTARIWGTSGIGAGGRAAELAGHHDGVLTATFSPDGRSVVTGSSDGTARLWDAQIEQVLQPVAQEGSKVIDTRIVGPDRLLYVTPNAAQLRAPRGGRKLESVPIQPATDVAATSPDGSIVAAAGEDGVVRLYPLNGSGISSFAVGDKVQALRFSTDGRLLAVAAGNVAEIWNVADRSLVARMRHPGPVTSVAFGRSQLATGAEDGTIRIWDEKGKLVRSFRDHVAPILDVRFDPAGERVVASSAGIERNVVMWDAKTGARLKVLVGHFGSVTRASFSSDGRWIVTAGPISAAVWPTDTGRLLLYLRGHSDLLTDAEWAPSGYRVTTASRDGSVRTYECVVCRPLEDLLAIARERLRTGRR
jgi:WD40 repeat protein